MPHGWAIFLCVMMGIFVSMSAYLIHHYMRTRPITMTTPVDTVCICMPQRKPMAQKLQKRFERWKLPFRIFDAVVGTEWVHQKLPLTLSTKFKHFVDKQPGHLGAALSHLSLWHDLARAKHTQTTLIVEEDIVIDSDFHRQLDEKLQQLDALDPEWDILLLGCSCSYDTFYRCHENDGLDIDSSGIAPLKYGIGLWAYVLRSGSVANTLLKGFNRHLEWAVDHAMMDVVAKEDLHMYTTIPQLARHPGTFSIDSFQYKVRTNSGFYQSTTNK